MASSRFPGKPLLDLLGMPMIEHVWHRTKMCEHLDEVYIATCDTEIQLASESFGAKVIMTKDTHEMCMDRVVEAASKVKVDIVVTVQGDEPLIQPEMISKTVQALKNDPSLPSATLAQKITDTSEIDNPNRVKIVWNNNKEVLYISRESIPSKKKFSNNIDLYKMVCVYAMTYDFLMKFGTMPVSYLEKIESIDMLRIIENNYRLKINLVDGVLSNIDIPEDQDLVIDLLKKDSLFLEYQKFSKLN